MENSNSLLMAKEILGQFGIILAAGTFGGVIAQRIRIPDVAIFLLIGILIGPEMLGAVNIHAESALNQFILIFGSCYILFDGGTTLRFDVLKRVWISIALLATIGVVITAFVLAFTAHFLFSLPLLVALLVGSTIASTDPATLVPIFKQVPIRDRVAQTVMSESAFNDATGAIVTFTVLGLAVGSSDTFSLSHSMLELLKQAGIGVLIGGVLGYLASLLIGHPRFAFLGEFAPVVTLMAVAGAYLGADDYHASGFMAVFVFGMILGNKEVFGFKMVPEEAHHMESFVASMALIMRLLIFILLGAQVNFDLMAKYWVHGVVIVAVLMFVARPAVVFLCTSVDRRAKWTWQEKLFMCWTRETGVIPAALAGLLVGMGAPGSDVIASVTFIAILITIIVQATTTQWLAGRLGLLVEHWED